MNMDGKKIAENLFFAVTCVSIFTCVVRSDYNFAIGLLCYYMVKNANEKMGRIATTVSSFNDHKSPFGFQMSVSAH